MGVFFPAGVLAGSLLGAAVYFLLGILLAEWLFGTDPDATWIEILTTVAGVIGTLIVGAWIAPSKDKRLPILILMLPTVARFIFIAFVSVLVKVTEGGGGWGHLPDASAALVTAIAMWFILLRSYRREVSHRGNGAISHDQDTDHGQAVGMLTFKSRSIFASIAYFGFLMVSILILVCLRAIWSNEDSEMATYWAIASALWIPMLLCFSIPTALVAWREWPLLILTALHVSLAVLIGLFIFLQEKDFDSPPISEQSLEIIFASISVITILLCLRWFLWMAWIIVRYVRREHSELDDR